jgi:hypothetical protein
MRVIPRSVGEQGKEKEFLNPKRAPISAVMPGFMPGIHVFF